MLNVGKNIYQAGHFLKNFNFIQMLLITLALVGFFSFANTTTTNAVDGSCGNTAADDDGCFENNRGKTGLSTTAYNKAIDDCMAENGLKWTSWYDNTRGRCSNALVSCTTQTSDRNRCLSGQVLARGADKGGNIDYDDGSANDWRSIQAAEDATGRDNEDTRSFRYNELVPFIDAQCDPIPDAAANKACRDKITQAFDKCYEDLGGNRTNVDATKLAECVSAATGIPKDDLTKAWGVNPDPADPNAAGAGGGSKNNCQVQKSGWLVCSITEFFADLVNKLYEHALKDLMVIPPINVSSGSSNDLYTAWELMRNIANVAFVIVFIIIILSQVTSLGLNNYGIKRMLPRLIIAAILVNVSYWICALAVDISNILGGALYEVFGANSGTVNFDIDDKGFTSQGSGWVTLALGILGSASIVYLGLSILLPVLITVLMACITVILTLTLRQALVILLIVVSPLAFVAYLLPNTESLFKKWLKLFQLMLILYPMIALLFRAAALAGTILQQSSKLMLVQIVGAALPVIPALVIPKIFEMAGGILNKLGAIANNPNKGIGDRSRKKAEEYRKRSQDRRAIRALNGNMTGTANVLSGGRFRRQARRQAIDSGVAVELQRSQQQYTAQAIKNDEGFRSKVAGGSFTGGDGSPAAMQRALERAEFTIEKANLEEVQAARLRIESLDQGATQAMLPGAGTATEANAAQMAAIQKTVESMDIAGIDHLLNSSSSWGNTESAKALRKTLADALSKSKPAYIGQGDIAAIRGGTNVAAEDMRVNAINNGAYSAEKIAGADKDELNAMFNTAQSRAVAMTPGRRKFIDNAKQATTNDVLKTKIGKNAAVVDKIKNLP